MIATTPALKAEIQKLRGRRLHVRCRIDYSDANLDNTVIAWSAENQENTYISQVVNGKEDTSERFLALDGKWILGEDWALAPASVTEQANFEIGWWSKSLSTPTGVFQDGNSYLLGERLLNEFDLGPLVEYPELFVNFLPRTMTAVRLSFDIARNEYAVDFSITFYNSAGAILHNIDVAGNAGIRYVADMAELNAVSQMRISIRKWSEIGVSAKVAEMFTAITDLYGEDDILSLQVVENRELPEDGIPLGQTASGSCVLTLFNRDRAFDFDNVTSKLYNVVREGVRITPEIGDGTTWIPLGVYYAKAWDIDKQSLSVTVTGVDRMALLDETIFSSNVIVQAPSPQTFLITSTAEWNTGTKVDTAAASGSLRMVY